MFNSDKSFAYMLAVAALATLGLSLTVLALSMIPVAARAAEDAQGPQSAVVEFDRANLGTPAGLADLYQRILEASARVCGSLETPFPESESAWRDCYRHTVARTVRSVRDGSLSAYHWKRVRSRQEYPIGPPSPFALRECPAECLLLAETTRRAPGP